MLNVTPTMHAPCRRAVEALIAKGKQKQKQNRHSERDHHHHIVTTQNATSSSDRLLLTPIPANPRVKVRFPLTTNAHIPGTPLGQIILQPCQHQLTQPAIPRLRGPRQLKLIHRPPLLNLPQTHMHQVSRPRRQIIQDMRRIDNGTRSRLGLALQEGQEITAAQQVQIDRDLIQQ